MSASGERVAAAALAGRRAAAVTARRPGTRLLACGAAASAATVAIYAAGWAAGWWYLTPQPLDLQVYVDGGLIVRHVLPLYDPHAASPLYGWSSLRGFMFTYTPFAAVAFAVVSILPWSVLPQVSVAASMVSLAACCWLTLSVLGYRGRVRTGAALLAAGILLWTEPVQRTLLLGQVNLVLLVLILADLCVPEKMDGPWWKRTWWAGAGIGIAAGIKLVPLIFIPYLLLTRRIRQAAVATATFAATIALGFTVLPRDSATWWIHGLFFQGTRAGFPGVMQNQSLRGLLTRLAGSVTAGTPWWIAAATLTTIIGLAAATALHRAGHPMPAILTTALTGLLISPISWDHHWVWIIPGLITMTSLTLRTWQAGRHRTATSLATLTTLTWAAFAAWPIAVWVRHTALTGSYGLDGLIWAVPNTSETVFTQLGDRPWFPEYHYRGLELLGGNLYILTGLVLFALLTAAAIHLTRRLPGRAPACRRPGAGAEAITASAG